MDNNLKGIDAKVEKFLEASAGNYKADALESLQTRIKSCITLLCIIIEKIDDLSSQELNATKTIAQNQLALSKSLNAVLTALAAEKKAEEFTEYAHNRE